MGVAPAEFGELRVGPPRRVPACLLSGLSKKRLLEIALLASLALYDLLVYLSNSS